MDCVIPDKVASLLVVIFLSSHNCVNRWFCDKSHFTRLDIAIDDRNEVPYFTIKQLSGNVNVRNISPTVIPTDSMRANTRNTALQRQSISVLVSLACPIGSMTRTKRSA